MMLWWYLLIKVTAHDFERRVGEGVEGGVNEDESKSGAKVGAKIL
jgi:hypothetical protein